jgi:hypothetical protein
MPSSREPWLHLSELCTWLCGRQESPVFCAAALSKRAIIAAGEGGEHVDLHTYRRGDKRRPQSGSKASLADVGLMVPSQERGFQ